MLPAGGGEGAYFAGPVGEAAVEFAVDDQAGAGAQAGEQEHHVLRVARDPVPGFRQRRELAVVLDPDRTRHQPPYVSAKVDPGPLRQRVGQHHLPHAVDKPGRRHPRRPDLPRLDARARQRLAHAPIQRRQPLTPAELRVDLDPALVQHLAVQVGHERERLVPADVDPEQPPSPGVEPVPPSRPPDRPGRRRHLGQPAAPEQVPRHVLRRSARQPCPLRQLGERQRLIAAQLPQYGGRVELAQPREIPAGRLFTHRDTSPISWTPG